MRFVPGVALQAGPYRPCLSCLYWNVAVLQHACCPGQDIEWPSVCRYVVPLVFYAMHKRWTTKRPLKDEWPHRPLITDVGLQQVVVDDGVALAEVSGAQG